MVGTQAVVKLQKYGVLGKVMAAGSCPGLLCSESDSTGTSAMLVMALRYNLAHE
jgi:hypothetical protein